MPIPIPIASSLRILCSDKHSAVPAWHAGSVAVPLVRSDFTALEIFPNDLRWVAESRKISKNAMLLIRWARDVYQACLSCCQESLTESVGRAQISMLYDVARAFFWSSMQTSGEWYVKQDAVPINFFKWALPVSMDFAGFCHLYFMQLYTCAGIRIIDFPSWCQTSDFWKASARSIDSFRTFHSLPIYAFECFDFWNMLISFEFFIFFWYCCCAISKVSRETSRVAVSSTFCSIK